MSTPAPYAPACHACGAPLSPPGHSCDFCRAPQPQMAPAAYAPQPVAMVGAKSTGVAVLLSFLWLGAGHLYANRVLTGVLLLVYDAFLVLLCFTFVGALLAVPLWLVSAPIVMILAAGAAKDFNRRNGILVR